MTRTHDLLITNQLLYRLSYTSIFYFDGNLPCCSIIVKERELVNGKITIIQIVFYLAKQMETARKVMRQGDQTKKERLK